MKLVYRGQAYKYSPAMVPATAATGAPLTLLYRGSAYQCSCTTLRSTRLPGVINWRFASVA